MREININFKLLKEQIKAMLNSDMEEEPKAGLHELLGTIYDLKDEIGKDKCVEIVVCAT